MAGNIKGITIEFDGDVSKLQKSLKEVDKTSSQVDKRLREIGKSLKFNPGNTELIAQKQRALAEKVQITSEKLKALRSADSELKKQLANGTLGQEKYDELQREIIETESKLDHFKSQVKEIDNIKLNNLAQNFQKLGDKLKNLGQKIGNFGSQLSMKVTAPLMLVGTAGFNMAAELQDAMGATDQIFKGSSKDIKDWANTLGAQYGIAEGEALQYANTMGAMLKNIGGLSDKEASKQAQTLTELAGDLSAMFGGTTESAVQALTNALKGNTSMLDNYGMGVNDATIKAKALEMGLYSGKGALDLQSKQAATLALIMEQTADAQGQAGREAEGASGSMKILTTTIKNLATDIGEVLLPIITPLIQKFGEWAKRMKELDPETQKMIVKVGIIAAALGPILIIVSKIVGAMGTVSSGIGFLITKITALATSTGALGTAFQFIAGHFAVIVAGIGLVVGAFVTLWNTNEEFKNNILGIWETIKSTFESLVTGIQERLAGLQLAFQNIIAFITPIWNEFCNMLAPVFEAAFYLISEIFNAAKNVIIGILDIFIGIFTGNWSQAWEGVKNIFSSVWTAIENIITYVIETIGLVIENGVNFIKLTVTSVWESMKSAAVGIWNALGGSISSVWENIKLVVSNAVSAVSGTVTRIFDNLMITVENTWESIKDAITGPIEKAKELVGKAIDAIKGFFNFEFKWPKLKMPHFSISGSINPFSPDFPPKVGVDWYAQGGIFDSPSVIGVGEAGSEAVVPTNKLDKFLADGVSRVLQGLDGTSGKGDIVINVKEMNVREDSDIRRVAEEVQRLIDLKMSRVSNAGGLL